MPRDWKLALQGIALGCLLTSLSLWSAITSLAQTWSSSQTYQYAWLIAPLIAYLLSRQQSTGTLLARPAPDLYGVAIAIVVALCWIAADLVNIDAGRQIAFVLAIQSVVMAALGWRCYWKLAPILGLMFFMIPSGDLLQPVLRPLTVKVIEFIAFVFHLPHEVNGFLITVGENDYVVLNECSGLAYFLLASFLGYAFGLMLYRSIYKILGLALFGAIIGLLSNALRVSGIVLIDWASGTQMPLSAHANVQWVALLICMGLLFFVLSKLQRDEFPAGDELAHAIPASHPLLWAPVFAGIAISVISGAPTWMENKAPPGRGASRQVAVPQSISDWQLTSPRAAWVENAQNSSRSLMFHYQRAGKTLNIQVVETMRAEEKLQESAIVPGTINTWHENSIETLAACVGSDCMKLLHTAWEDGKTEEQKHVYSSYALGSFYTTSKFAFRLAHGWARLTGRNYQPRLIGITLDTALAPADTNSLGVIVRSIQSVLETRQ